MNRKDLKGKNSKQLNPNSSPASLPIGNFIASHPIAPLFNVCGWLAGLKAAEK